jgi:hypothetical protein
MDGSGSPAKDSSTFRPFGEMTIVQGAGWGGGSLIYANVHLRAPAGIFQSGWPAGYGRAPRSILTTT